MINPTKYKKTRYCKPPGFEYVGIATFINSIVEFREPDQPGDIPVIALGWTQQCLTHHGDYYEQQCDIITDGHNFYELHEFKTISGNNLRVVYSHLMIDRKEREELNGIIQGWLDQLVV